jgi:enoyl-CoA hydratase/carnithine racemase
VTVIEEQLVVTRGDWTELVINRPDKRNALTPDLLFEIARQVTTLESPTVVVLRAAGEAAFSAGFDLSVLRDRGAAAHDGDPIGTAVAALRACPAPVVAALQGFCWGAALELVTGCDVRVGADNLSVAVPANRLGSLYRPEGIESLTRRYGVQTASDLLVGGVRFDAETARARGVVSSVVPLARLEEATSAVARRIHEAPVAAARHKQFLRELDAAATPLPQEFWLRWNAVRAGDVDARQERL